LDMSSLILIPPVDFPVVFLALFWGVRLPMAFYLPARVFRVLAPALVKGPLVDSLPEGRAKTRIARIRMSPLKPGTGEMKLSNVCIQTKEM
jgi:hypothetical protein